MEPLLLALACRLEAFSIVHTRFDRMWSQVRFLTGLRVLSMICHCAAASLEPLHPLEVVHLSRSLWNGDECREIMVAIRRLSVEHRLRTLSIDDLAVPTEFDVCALVRPLPDGLTPATD